MSRIIVYDVLTGNIVEYNPSANTPEYMGRNDIIMNPDENLIAKGLRYIKVDKGVLIEKSTEEKSVIDAEIISSGVNPLVEMDSRIKNLETEIELLKKLP